MIQRIVMILLIVVAVLGGGYYAYQQLVPQPEDTATGPVYATQPVVRGDISVGVDTSGPLNPNRGGGIQAPGGYGPMPSGPTSYIIEAVLVAEGDEVRQGQTLVRLSAADLETRIKAKEQKLTADRETLAALAGVSPDQLNSIRAGQGITLRAPIAGRVVGLDVKAGQELKQGSIVARVVDDSHFRMTAKLTPSEFTRIKEGQRVVLRFAQFDGLLDARVAEVNPEPIPEASSDLLDSLGVLGKDEDNYQFVYWATLEGKNTGLVRPGMRAQVGVPVDLPGYAREDLAARGIEPAQFFRYYSEVEGYAAEEQILSGAKAIATRVFVHEMERVKAGDSLVSLAGEDAQDMIRQQLEAIGELELEIQQLRAQFRELEVRASMDGVVANIEAQPGMTVQSGQWFGSIFNTADMRMWVQVDDVDVLLVKQGSPVKVTVGALPGKTFVGEVEHVAMMGKDESGITRFQVNIKVAGSPELRPGMQAEAHIDAGSAQGVLLVPLEAIFEEDGQPKVEILQPNGVPKVVPVELGLMNDRVAEVKSGLEEGWLVITGSTADLLPSQTIKSNDGLLPSPGKGPDDGGGGGNGGNGGDNGSKAPGPATPGPK